MLQDGKDRGFYGKVRSVGGIRIVLTQQPSLILNFFTTGSIVLAATSHTGGLWVKMRNGNQAMTRF